ncbi:MAG: DUF4838 domain-containing protein [Armatimonadetes bacterium]|nr:DUF4838 domain-containing protein [Armatimonadota bacterium]
MRLCVLTAATLCAAATAGAAPLTLAQNGRTAYHILIDPQATPAEQHAAAELAAFLRQVTGVEFPIRQGTQAGPEPALVVGPGRAAKALASQIRFDRLSPDGIVLETRGRHLVLAGDRPRGTLYAVYTFLEDVVGCRWWSSKASTIPRKRTLVVPELHRRYIPPLEYREVFWYDAFDPDWAVRNKSNGDRPKLDEARGGQIRYGGPFMVHTFNLLVPWKEHFQEHPEWFSEIEGRRVASEMNNQLCLTNEALKEFMTAQVLAWLEKEPDTRILSVSQNDGLGRCECAACRALEEKEGSPSGPLLHFVNYVAERVARQYPNVAIDTLAYSYTRKPPKHVRPLPNVIVRLCSVECSFLEPLATSKRDQAFREDLQAWSRICQRLYVWDYTTNFAHYLSPYPNLGVLGPNVRFFADHGVKGIFEQGAYNSPGAELAEMKAWVLAKLLWDPRRDARALIREFARGYYGPAAPFILAYIDAVHRSAVESGQALGITVSPNAPFLTLKLLAHLEQLFDQAEAAVAGNPELLERVQVARLPVRYVWARRWLEFARQAAAEGVAWPGPPDYVENCQTFLEVARRHGITRVAEGAPLGTFEQLTLGTSLGPHWVRDWIASRLPGEPRMKDAAAVAQAIEESFGPAAPAMLGVLRELAEAIVAGRKHLHGYVAADAPALGLAEMGRLEAAFNQAEAAVQDDPEALSRVQVARLPLRYLWARRWSELQQRAKLAGTPWPGPADYAENCRTFLEVARRNNVAALSPGTPVSRFEEQCLALGRRPAPPPPGCEALDPSQYLDFQDDGFLFVQEARWAARERDDLASDGVALRVSTNHREWAAQSWMETAPRETRYTYYASIRCEKTGNAGTAFGLGLYDLTNGQVVEQRTVDCQDVPDDGRYHTYKITTAPLRGEMYLFVHPTNNPENVQAIWVDRFWVVKEK